MGGSLTEARKRLPSLDDLEQAAALLNVPGLDDADRNTGAPPAGGAARQDRRLGGAIGQGSRGARRAALQRCPEPYAYLIETVDEHDGTWWNAGPEGSSGGIEDSPDSPETYAAAAMNRYLDHMRDHLDDYEDTLMGELHVRVSVWSVRSVTAAHPTTAPDPDRCPPARYGHLLKVARISPRAVEIRTPLQVHNHVYGGGITA